MKTNAAKAASLIRKEIKTAFPSVNAKVTSKVYSGGSSVNVSIYDQPEEIFSVVRKIVDKYEYGTFDGMTDSYNYDNKREDLPQVRFAFVSNYRSA